MRLLDWRKWRRRATPVASTSTILPLERTAPHVPGEYLSLYTYLERRYSSIVVLTFEQMEALLGFALPASACSEPDWWTRPAMPRHRHSAAWTKAGRTATPNLVAKIVTFERR